MDKIIKWNNQLLSWNNGIIRTEIVADSSSSGFPTNGLVSYWSFDDIDNTTINDSYGNNNLTASTASIFSVNGYHNDCIDFSSASYYVRSSKNLYNLVGNNNFSIAFWAYIIHTNSRSPLVSDYENFSGMTIRNEYTNCVTYIYPDDYRLTLTDAFTSTKWYHIVYTINSSNYYKMYIDGTYKDGMQAGELGDSDGLFTLGARGDLATSGVGKIDEISIWNKELTSTEVSNLYNNGDGIFY